MVRREAKRACRTGRVPGQARGRSEAEEEGQTNRRSNQADLLANAGAAEQRLGPPPSKPSPVSVKQTTVERSR